MGITKLLHIKERKTGNRAAGVLNSIYYIMNPEKTQNQRLIGGNCGRDEEMIYRKFMDTKSMYEKYDGRQAYHFVISFPPEENVSTAICMNVISDFVDEYLKNEYDVVFTVHDDQEHMHGHILFNSVNAMTGRKYRYEDGDWEKYIQPITDKIAKRYGLSELEFIKKEDEPEINWNEKIKEDISECIKISKDYEDFKQKMQSEFYYKIREGNSKIHGLYLSFKPEGKSKAVRSYQLPKECQPYDIYRRIRLKEKAVVIVPVVKSYYFSNVFYKRRANSFVKWNQMSIYQKANARKVYQAQRLYHRTNNNPSWENERIVRGINTQMKNYQLMLKNNLTSESDVELFREENSHKLKEVNQEIRKWKRQYRDFTSGEPSVFAQYEEMATLKEKDNLSPEETEKLAELEEVMEVNYVGEVYQEYEDKLQELYEHKEKIKKNLSTARNILKEMPYFKKADYRKEKTQTEEMQKEEKQAEKKHRTEPKR